MPNGMFSLEGKVALVTGANSGIGRELALALRDAGAKVAIGARRADRNAKVLEELGPDGSSFQLDVSDEQSVEKAIAGVAGRYGSLDILINNAGAVNKKSVMELDRSAWDHVMAVNVTGAFLCTKHAARLMKEQGGGKIVNVSSVYGLTAPSKGLQVAYTASKHAVIGLTKVNAVELAEYGIQVNAIAPGFFLTEMTADIGGSPMERALIRRTPSGHLGETKDLVGTCIYLVSGASNHVTGMCIAVDGGYVVSDGMERG